MTDKATGSHEIRLDAPGITVVTTRYSFRLDPATARPLHQRQSLATRDDAVALLTQLIGDEISEVLVLLMLDARFDLLGFCEVVRGTYNMATTTVRDVYMHALLANAGSIILAHNHPGGSSQPSQHDRRFTTAMREGGLLLGVRLVDSLIVGQDGVFSIAADENWHLSNDRRRRPDQPPWPVPSAAA